MITPTLRHIAALAVLAAATLTTVPGRADSDQDRARAALEAGAVQPLSRVLATAESQFEGQMVEAELEDKHGQWVYELKLLTPGGSLLKLYYDAANGRLVRARGHRLMQWWRGTAEDLPPDLRARWEHHQATGGAGGDGPPPGKQRHGWFSGWWDGKPGSSSKHDRDDDDDDDD